MNDAVSKFMPNQSLREFLLSGLTNVGKSSAKEPTLTPLIPERSVLEYDNDGFLNWDRELFEREISRELLSYGRDELAGSSEEWPEIKVVIDNVAA